MEESTIFNCGDKARLQMVLNYVIRKWFESPDGFAQGKDEFESGRAMLCLQVMSKSFNIAFSEWMDMLKEAQRQADYSEEKLSNVIEFQIKEILDNKLNKEE